MSAAKKICRYAILTTLAATLAGCGASILPSTLLTPRENPAPLNGPTASTDKLIVVPAQASDLDCPDVGVTEGGASARVGGASNADVRYQFDISDTARECDPQGNKLFGLKVGVSGRLLLGPAGSPGTYSTTLHVLVKRDIDDKVLFTKAYPVTANTGGGDQAPFQIVTEPIVLPLTRARLDQDYSIEVGLGGGGGAPAAHRRKRARHQG